MITAAAVAFVTSAAPIEERLVGGQIANFDDLTTPTVVSLTSLGTYKGLNYSGICTYLTSTTISSCLYLSQPIYHSPRQHFVYLRHIHLNTK